MAWRRCRRKPILSGLVGSLVLSVLFGCVGVAWQWRRAQSQRRLAEGNLTRPGSNACEPCKP